MGQHPYLRKAAWYICSLSVALTLGTATAHAESGNNSPITTDSTAPTFSNNSSMAGSLIWVVVALAFVIALIMFVIKWLSKRNQSWGTNHTLRSLGGISLGQNKSLQIIEIAGKVYVVGIGESITLLDKIDDAAHLEQLLEQLNQPASGIFGTASLSEWISNLRKPRNQQKPDIEQSWKGSSFQEMLDNRMEQHSKRQEEMEQVLKEPNQR